MKKLHNFSKKFISLLLLLSMSFSAVACGGGSSGSGSTSSSQVSETVSGSDNSGSQADQSGSVENSESTSVSGDSSAESSDGTSVGGGDSSTEDGGSNEFNATGKLTHDLSMTLHVYDVKEGTVPFIVNGESEYTIVYPATVAGNGHILNAVAELRAKIKEATGIMLPAVSDAEKLDSNKIISLFNTQQAVANTEANDFYNEYEEKLGMQGYVIKTSGNSVYLRGTSVQGSMYAALEFLHWQFDYEFYAKGSYDLLHNVKDMNLKNFNLIDVPDLQSRTTPSGQGGIGFRNMSEAEHFNYVAGNTWCHNWLELIPKDKYGDHPEWYGGGVQLCLEAGGDAESRQELIDAVVYEMTWRLEADPTKNWIAFSHEDGGTWCGCQACNKDIGLYDAGIKAAAFASLVRFTNEVAVKVKAWNQENCPDRDITIFIYRYGKPAAMPVKVDENKQPILDENGNYQPYSEDLWIEDNIGVIFCGFSGYTEYIGHPDVTDPDALKRITDCMKEPTIYFWLYSAIFRDYIAPASFIDTRQDFYQYCISQGGVAMMDMGRYSSSNGTDWTALKQYLSAKLMWNCQVDVQELTKNFMRATFGDASDIMMEMYQESRVWKQYLIENDVAINTASSVAAKNYPLGTIMKFKKYIDEAFKAIEGLKLTNPAEYEILYTNILRESLTWRYLEIKLYPSSWSGEELKVVQKQFIADCNTAGITQAFEHSSINQIFG